MKEHRNYTIEIKLTSPVVTRFQSDSLFGHICWAIRFLKWDVPDRLNDFLNSYGEKQSPPLLISNGFPKGYLPKPVIPPVTQKELDDVIGKENRIKNSHIVKTIKKIDIISKHNLKQLCKDKITPSSLFKITYENFEDIEKFEKKEQSTVVQHNTINRLENRVKRGLYTQEEIFFDEDGGEFEIYLKTNYFTMMELQRIFGYIREEGFGRDKSTGKGAFDFNIKDGFDLPESKEPNAFMSLSSYIPCKYDPKEGFYNILLKYGKLGGIYSKGISEVYKNPFKKPLIMFAAGSTFYDTGYIREKTYGSLLRDVHKNDKIRHYAYAFPIGLKLEEKHEDT
jgi:CRISPR-associated protein Csm4